ncbi:MAG: VWA domain-containing protein [Gemmatimonadota bacterium]|nr:VWA domain-containing protein [Gemmatimonadota bacterium]
MKTNVSLDHEPVGDGGWLVRALLRIEGEARTQEGRVPLNLSIVLDRSGSMSGGKLEAAKEAARLLVRRLAPEDAVSVVAYDDEVETVALPATGESQEDLVARIGTIDTGGMTNLSGGWLKGREHVAARHRRGGVNRVLLLTDGLANVGITDPATLEGLCRTAAAEHGLTTTTIGFGAGYAEDLLRAMADAGGGSTYYIERPDQAPGVFEEELEGLLSIAAQNLTVRIEPTGGNEFVQVWHSYPATASGAALDLAVGDLYAREPRLVLAEFLLKPPAEGAEEDEVEVATFTVSADVLTGEGNVEKQTVTLPVRLSPLDGGHVDPVVRKELLHQEAARVRRQTLKDWESGRVEEAGQALHALSRRIREESPGDEELLEEAADLEALAERSMAHGVVREDEKYMFQRAYDASRSKRMASHRVSRTKRGGEE